MLGEDSVINSRPVAYTVSLSSAFGELIVIKKQIFENLIWRSE